MVGKIFVLWSWKYLGEKVSATLEKEMSADFRSQVHRSSLFPPFLFFACL